MKSYELWLDESGSFQPVEQKNAKLNPSLIGGVLIEQGMISDPELQSLTCESGTEGFIHSVGHGIGLDIHEYPSVGSQPIALKPGMVITVEPGLYFPIVGGVRIEDDVVITNDGCEILTSCEKTLELL